MVFRTLIILMASVWAVCGVQIPVCHAGKQAKEKAFYDVGNRVTVKITMDPAQWSALLQETPKGGNCNFKYDEEKEGPRYPWHPVQSITISGTTAPAQPLTLTNIEIRKKSYCGSFSTTKPSLKIKMKGTAGKQAKNAIGISNLIFNNAIQPPGQLSYIRQCTGYKIIGLAGLPTPLCNAMSVTVNGQSYGAFVNLEPFKKPYVKRNFDGNVKGNLYELSYSDDLVPSTNTDLFGFKGYSSNSSRSDLKQVINALAKGDIATLGTLVDLNEFDRFWAMEILLREWDGYSSNTNNTYVYNDLDLSLPANKDKVDLKFALWGIDQILQKNTLTLYHKGKLADVLYNNPASLAKLKAQLANYGQGIFSQAYLEKNIFPYMDQLVNQFDALPGVHQPVINPAVVAQLKATLKSTPDELKKLGISSTQAQ